MELQKKWFNQVFLTFFVNAIDQRKLEIKKKKKKKRNKVARGLNRSIHFSFFVCLSIRSRYPKGEIEILGNNFKDLLAIVTALSWNMLHQTTLESNWNQEQFELNCCKISYCGKFSPDHTDNLKNSREINT